MVLRLKTRESRSLPGLLKAMPRNISGQYNLLENTKNKHHFRTQKVHILGDAGWSSPFGLISIHWIDILTASPHQATPDFAPGLKTRTLGDAGWSSPVARQAHNLKAAGSNPAPATNKTGNPSQSASFSPRIAWHRFRYLTFSCTVLNSPAAYCRRMKSRFVQRLQFP